MKSTGLYIHIPFCERKCLYCDFNSGPASESIKSKYMDALIKELFLYKDVLQSMKIQTLFIGGGTPSSVPPSLFEPLLKALHEIVDFNLVEEFTIEANPGTVDKEKLLLYRRYGINRLSFGVQSFKDKLLKRIGRLHNRDQAIRSIKLAKDLGFDNINIDLMHNLPAMTAEDLYESIQCAIDLGVNHLSLYSLILEEGTPLYNEYEEKGLPLLDEEEERQVFHHALSQMTEKGFKRYEVSNFALEGKVCLHNMIYWQVGDYIGLGVGAHGKLNHNRYFNVGSIDAYLEEVACGNKPVEEVEALPLEEEAFEAIMLGLRLIEGINLSGFVDKYGYSVEKKFKETIEEQKSLGTLEIVAGYLRLTTYGHDVANAVTIAFMD